LRYLTLNGGTVLRSLRYLPISSKYRHQETWCWPLATITCCMLGMCHHWHGIYAEMGGATWMSHHPRYLRGIAPSNPRCAYLTYAGRILPWLYILTLLLVLPLRGTETLQRFLSSRSSSFRFCQHSGLWVATDERRRWIKWMAMDLHYRMYNFQPR